jgi:hypothetical protein
MAIRVLLTYEKQSNSGEFITIPENIIALLNTYKDQGKLLDFSKDESQKDKVCYTIDWVTEEAKQEFRSEPSVLTFADDANEHNFKNNIFANLDEFYV